MRCLLRRGAPALRWVRVASLGCALLGGCALLEGCARSAGAESGSAETLKRMSKRRRTGFPHVMRLARWLRCPAVALTRIATW